MNKICRHGHLGPILDANTKVPPMCLACRKPVNPVELRSYYTRDLIVKRLIIAANGTSAGAQEKNK